MCWIDTVRRIRKIVKRRVGQMSISYQVVEEYILRVSQPVQRIWNGACNYLPLQRFKDDNLV